jgi:hypothetical protein
MRLPLATALPVRIATRNYYRKSLSILSLINQDIKIKIRRKILFLNKREYTAMTCMSA